MTYETLVSEIGRHLQFFFIRSTSSRKSSICERLPKEHASGRAAGVSSPSGSKTFHAMEDFTDRRLRFAYRRNADATVDSICLQCFRTVGTAVLASGLQHLESQHHCEPGASGVPRGEGKSARVGRSDASSSSARSK
jgi:hypothetical protein